MWDKCLHQTFPLSAWSYSLQYLTLPPWEKQSLTGYPIYASHNRICLYQLILSFWGPRENNLFVQPLLWASIFCLQVISWWASFAPSAKHQHPSELWWSELHVTLQIGPKQSFTQLQHDFLTFILNVLTDRGKQEELKVRYNYYSTLPPCIATFSEQPSCTPL